MITQENIPYTADEIKAMAKTCEKYNKAREKARELMNKGYDVLMPEIFPELNENEDEKIKREIVAYINELADLKNEKIPTKWLAWLEEQKDYIKLPNSAYTSNKDVIEFADTYSHDVWEKLMDNFKKIENYHIGCNDVSDIVLNAIINTYNWLEKQGAKKRIFNADDWYVSEVDGKIHNPKFIEKQGEKKPTDKVEHLIPQKGIYYTCIKDYYSANNTHLCVKGNIYKSSYNGYIDDESHFGLSWNSYAEKYFEPTKDEDWIVCEHDNVIGKPMQYKEFKEKINQNFIKNLKAQGITPKLRLWTIEDAKDGDVLVCSINKAEIGGDVEKLPNMTPTIFIYKNVVKDSDYIHSYCSLYNRSSLRLQNAMYYNTFVCYIHPATKEEHDLLFQKMKEAGYEWDANKKELKRIKPKTLDPDKVIEWLKNTIKERAENYGVYKENRLILPYNSIEDLITDFKEDFGL